MDYFTKLGTVYVSMSITVNVNTEPSSGVGAKGVIIKLGIEFHW